MDKWNTNQITGTCSVHITQDYYKTDTSKDLLGKISFKFCTINSTFLRLISNNFTAPILMLLITGYY